MKKAAVILCVMMAAWSSPLVADHGNASDGDEIVVFVVRHAEKMKAADSEDPANPHLNEAGRARAVELVRLLGEAGITMIHSTAYHRTVETARPLAERIGVAITSYDPRNLEEFAAALRETSGRHLVVGHSNTSPKLVELLGGVPGPPIDEPSEYDRLYLLKLGEDATTTIVIRFGESNDD